MESEPAEKNVFVGREIAGMENRNHTTFLKSVVLAVAVFGVTVMTVLVAVHLLGWGSFPFGRNLDSTDPIKLIASLNSVLEKVLYNPPSTIEEKSRFLSAYKKNLDLYYSKSSIITDSNSDSEKQTTLRLKEWHNRRLFDQLQKRWFASESLEGKFLELKKVFDERLFAFAVTSVSDLFPKRKKIATLWLREVLASTAPAEASESMVASESASIIHKKVILDPADPGETGKKLTCWSYESWIDLLSRDIRQEIRVTSGDINDSVEDACRSEINLTDGETGRKLALDTERKLAEWVGVGKIGIGEEETGDPFLEFKQKVEKKIYLVEGAQLYDDRAVYVLKEVIYEKDYQLIFLDALSYLPVRRILFVEEKVLKDISDDPQGRFEIIMTGNLKRDLNFIYSVGERQRRHDLPQGFFDLVIPDDYIIKEFVSHG